MAELDDKEDQDEQVDGDYVVDEKAKTATLTASGIAKAEKYFNVENLADGANMTLQHHINQAIKARGVMKRDVDYVVRDGEVIIVDEFTGRLMLGRRYNEGLHQAIEAKEGVTVARESRTLATITFQNYFRMYEKLSGMTGTAQTEAAEFEEIYGLQVVEVPTNKPVARTDYNDVVYKTEPAKFNAVIEQIIECHEKGQPVLVGTISIEKSELLSKLLSRRGVKHEVLNAKHHEKEAEIVAQAGKKGAVTIATNMAGRGTDIMLGGNAEYMAKAELRKAGFCEELIVREPPALPIPHDQEILKARAALCRAGGRAQKSHCGMKPTEDVARRAACSSSALNATSPAASTTSCAAVPAARATPAPAGFFISHGGRPDAPVRRRAHLATSMDILGVDEDTPIENKMLTNTIENAQKKLEGPQLRHP